jgi:hypothetical protein
MPGSPNEVSWQGPLRDTQKGRSVCLSEAMTPLSYRQSLIWIKARNPSEGFLEGTLFSGGSEHEGGVRSPRFA